MKTKQYFKYKLEQWQGLAIERDLYSYYTIINSINTLEESMLSRTDAALKLLAGEVRTKIRNGENPDSHLEITFALVREVSRRLLQMRPFDCQLIAAIALHQAKLAQMNTGEGKTLAAVMPVSLNAFTGKGVHVLTFNDYLARRDANWMRPVYEFLGLSVGFIQENMSMSEKKKAYECDITYATAKQVGFDFLYSYIAMDPSEISLRAFNFAIVDEADAILIDEARNPLVIAGNIIESKTDYYLVASFAAKLKSGEDFTTDEYQRDLFLTEIGISKAEIFFNTDNLFIQKNYDLLAAINLSMQAHQLLHKDVDYIIRDGKIKLVDEFTGRVVEDRKWQNGLQTAVEAKEGLVIQSEGTILGSIPLQHFISCYPKLAGMTATAEPAAEEFNGFFYLSVVVIPPNKICNRKDLTEEIYVDRAVKTLRIIEEVSALHKKDQPVLIGTLNVKESEELAAEFQKNQIPCHVLNAKNDEEEAEIIARAGIRGAVTISTNMAGRGTDIILGGEDNQSVSSVANSGGLHVIGTNRHESRRIDDQLRGRAGRQGDPGSSKFIISLEDELMMKYKLKELLPEKLRGIKQDSAISDLTIQSRIAQAQRIIEGQMYDLRRTLCDYTNFIEEQRKYFQGKRQTLLLENNYSYTIPDEIPQISTISISSDNMKKFILNQFDLTWAKHLNFASELRDGIHLVRLGGENPVRVYQKKTFEHFNLIEAEMEKTIADFMEKNPLGNDLPIKRPSSTWTYMVNDNPFGNRLSLTLLNNANIGMQADIFSMGILLVVGFFKRMFPNRSKPN